MRLCLVLAVILAVAYGFPQGSLRIFGGQAASRNQFPYQVSIQGSSILGLAHYCGAAILSPNYVVTAAHCVHYRDDDLRIVAGILSLKDKNVTGQQMKKIARNIMHPLYNGSLWNDVSSPYDIAVLRLDSPLTLGAGVQPVAIPKSGYVATGSGVLSGWGDTTYDAYFPPDILQYINVPVVPIDECKKIMDDLHQPTGRDSPLNITTHLCSGPGQLGKKQACSGDSGTPYVVDGKLAGIVVFGPGGCGHKQSGPTIYSKLAYFSDWIAKVTKNEVVPQ